MTSESKDRVVHALQAFEARLTNLEDELEPVRGSVARTEEMVAAMREDVAAIKALSQAAVVKSLGNQRDLDRLDEALLLQGVEVGKLRSDVDRHSIRLRRSNGHDAE